MAIDGTEGGTWHAPKRDLRVITNPAAGWTAPSPCTPAYSKAYSMLISFDPLRSSIQKLYITQIECA